MAWQMTQSKKAFFFSIFLHALLVFFLIINIDFSTHRRIVAEKGNAAEEVIHAVVLSAIPKTRNNQTQTIPVTSANIAKNSQQQIASHNAVQLAVSKIDARKQYAIALLPKKKQKDQLLLDLKKEVERKADHIKSIKKTQALQHQAQRLAQKKMAMAFAQQMKSLNKEALHRELVSETNRLDTLQEKKMQGEVDRYRALILQAISQHWRLPGIPDKHLYTDLLVHLAPGGGVLDVQIVKSSGNVGLDNSARVAVFRSSPLPVPQDPQAFAAFRAFVLRAKPEDILATY